MIVQNKIIGVTILVDNGNAVFAVDLVHHHPVALLALAPLALAVAQRLAHRAARALQVVDIVAVAQLARVVHRVRALVPLVVRAVLARPVVQSRIIISGGLSIRSGHRIYSFCIVM